MVSAPDFQCWQWQPPVRLPDFPAGYVPLEYCYLSSFLLVRVWAGMVSAPDFAVLNSGQSVPINLNCRSLCKLAPLGASFRAAASVLPDARRHRRGSLFPCPFRARACTPSSLQAAEAEVGKAAEAARHGTVANTQIHNRAGTACRSRDGQRPRLPRWQ